MKTLRKPLHLRCMWRVSRFRIVCTVLWRCSTSLGWVAFGPSIGGTGRRGRARGPCPKAGWHSERSALAHCQTYHRLSTARATTKASQQPKRRKCAFSTHVTLFTLGSIATTLYPSRIVATELRRDVSQDLDDHFEILIDSNHDRRGAYVFEVNPLGTQSDGLIVEEQGGGDGGDFDRGWDGVWTSEARITPDGWTATIEIPFTTLNFTHSSNVIWGLNLKRFIRRKNEEDLWSAYRRTFGITKVSEAGDLGGHQRHRKRKALHC